MTILKNWLFSKNNNKKHKKQQYIKALNISYINRKKKSRNLYIKHVKVFKNLKKLIPSTYFNINLNWLLL